MIANFIHKQIAIDFKDGDKMIGKVVNYTVAGDNDPEEESIDFVPSAGPLKGKNIEIFEHEVSNVKII